MPEIIPINQKLMGRANSCEIDSVGDENSTIKEIFEKEKFVIETRNALYNIGFVNSDGDDDETQFTVQTDTVEGAVEELEQLFTGFCQENGFDKKLVRYVEYAGQDAAMEL